MEGVVGSIPTRSTKTSTASVVCIWATFGLRCSLPPTCYPDREIQPLQLVIPTEGSVVQSFSSGRRSRPSGGACPERSRGDLRFSRLRPIAIYPLPPPPPPVFLKLQFSTFFLP